MPLWNVMMQIMTDHDTLSNIKSGSITFMIFHDISQYLRRVTGKSIRGLMIYHDNEKQQWKKCFNNLHIFFIVYRDTHWNANNNTER